MNLAAQSILQKNLAPATVQSDSLQVEGLSKRFKDTENPVFRDVSFNINNGQSVALIGANGAGKSTLLRCCIRLVEPDTGEISLSGENLSNKSGRALKKARNRVGFVFQKHCLVPRLSALTNVLHGNLAHRSGPRNWAQSLARQEDRQRALDCLEQVGLVDFAYQRCDQLSGGQSQRVAIARALMQEPSILFADEPTASLDPQSGEVVMELFARLSRSRNLTLFFVSHHVEHALNYADRIIGLRASELQLDTASHSESLQSLREFYV